MNTLTLGAGQSLSGFGSVTGSVAAANCAITPGANGNTGTLFISGNLNLNGGSINNVAINAAFLAAQAGTPVTMPLVLQAARNEFLKLKRPFNSDDFSWQEERATA